MEKKLTQADDLVIGQALGMVKQAATLLEFASDALKEIAEKKPYGWKYIDQARLDASEAQSRALLGTTAIRALYHVFAADKIINRD